jgi:CRP-like cAMP-binding protein
MFVHMANGRSPEQPTRNVLLDTLCGSEIDTLKPLLHPVDLQLQQVLEFCGKPIEHIYFPQTAVASVSTMQNERRVELGVVGRDGMIGITALLSDDVAQHETSTHVSGTALRMIVGDFKAAIETSHSLHSSLLRYVHSFLVQSARTALANEYWKIEERLARRLLLVHDRIDGDRISMTHGSLAGGLSVTRPGVTLALHILEGHGVIRARRSEITVLNREELKKLTRGSYGMLEEQFRPAKSF